MTIATTAEEIARNWVDESKVHRLELDILRHMEHHVEKAIAAEREACANIAERMGYEGDFDDEGSRIAKAIRTQTKE